jgi:hypothetical protein
MRAVIAVRWHNCERGWQVFWGSFRQLAERLNEPSYAQLDVGSGLMGAAIGGIAGGGRGAASGAIVGGSVGAVTSAFSPRPSYRPWRGAGTLDVGRRRRRSYEMQTTLARAGAGQL